MLQTALLTRRRASPAMVPLGLFLTRDAKKTQCTPAKKVVTDDNDDDKVSTDAPNSPADKKKESLRRASHKSALRTQEKVHSFAAAARAAERSDEKARIEACVKAGDLTGATACITRLAC